MVILVILAYALIIYWDLIPLYREKLWREFGVNLALTLLTFAIALLISVDVAIPSPINPIKRLVISILGK
ncbi:hypothetical protein [Desulfosporosinus sp. OT]|uniref:hypothetical protein n=1 Tax=Desulfosporosinus sp. OT TaxID=913865 RepID=UPI0002239C79|nr:hypothetical protein [Desulfosporosinus sp. OT]EGW40865.1 putative membrane protein [Desulfosporosinus sp. OT]